MVQLCDASTLCRFVSSFLFKAAFEQLMFQKWSWILGVSAHVGCGLLSPWTSVREMRGSEFFTFDKDLTKISLVHFLYHFFF